MSGSITHEPGSISHAELSPTGAAGFSGAGALTPALVRVRDAATGEPTTCADVLPTLTSPIFIASEGRFTYISFDLLDLSAGRCAGPRGADLDEALPRKRIATARLRRRAHVLDLSGRTPFVAGPFSGTLHSSVKVVFTRARPVRGEPQDGSNIRFGRDRSREAGLRLSYRVTGVTGALVTDFRGTPDVTCASFGACGASGTSSYTAPGANGVLEVLATRPLRRGRPAPGYRQVLGELRRGALDIVTFGDLSARGGRTTGSFTSSSGACSDVVESPSPEINLTAKGRAAAVRLGSLAGLGADSLRSRCPGPAEEDVLRGHSIALGHLDLASLGRPRLRIGVATGGSFAARGYAGTRHGRLEISLERTRAGVVTGTG